MMPSNLQEFFGLIAFFGFAALVIHSLWQASKRVPPATDRLPAGVDGALLIVAGLAFLAGIYDAAAAALTVRDEYIENVRAEYERRRNVLIKLMQRIPGVRCNLPKGAFYFVADLPVDDAEKFALYMLRDFSYEGCTVMFASAEDFYVTPGIGRTQARFSYVLNEEELVMAAKCLEEGLKAYRRDVMGLR